MGCIVRVVSHKKRCGGKRQSEFLRKSWGIAAAIQGPQTPEKSIYQARSSTVHYGFSRTFLLTRLLGRVFHAWQGWSKSIY